MMDPHCDIFILPSVTLPPSPMGDSSSAAPSDRAGEWVTRPAVGWICGVGGSICTSPFRVFWGLLLEEILAFCMQNAQTSDLNFMPSSEPGMLKNSGRSLSNVLFYCPCAYLVCMGCDFTYVCGGLWLLCSVISHLRGRKTPSTNEAGRHVLLRATEGWRLFLQSSVLYGETKSAKKTLLNPTSLFTVRAEFRAIVHCIYVRHPERLGWSLSSHYVPLCLPSTMSAGFGEMFLLQYVFLFLWQAN